MIRKTTKSDLPAIMELMKSVEGFWHESWSEKTLEKALESSGELALIYEESGRIVGSIFASDMGFRAYLSGLIVAENYRNQGIAKALIEKVECNLKEVECELVIADVLPNAIPFYEKLGWEPPYAKLYRKKLSGEKI